MSYLPYQPMMRNAGYEQQDQRFFPVLPFIAGLAVSPFLFGGYGYGRPNVFYGPNYGPNYGPSYGPGYGPNYGPGYGPSYGPQYGPVYPYYR
ncbi:penicillin-binding protein [Halalkalibacter oceani]|uniref:penicillin-binding protein n=1 Tax=Halalkalibacter oceani TaxID=1653776 RepID=UPI003396BD09